VYLTLAHSLIKFVIVIEPCIIQQAVIHFSSKRFRYKLNKFFKRYSPPPPSSAYYLANTSDLQCTTHSCKKQHERWSTPKKNARRPTTEI